MRSDSLWRVSVETSAEAEEAVAVLLETIFAQPPSIYTDAESGKITATVFLRKRPDAAAQLRKGFKRLRSYGLEPGAGRVSVHRVRKQDWSESWKRHFQPFTIGSKLLVKPSWSRRKPRRGQRVVVIDPGLSFGTGQHPTTRFCLEQIAAARQSRSRQSFLDVGTGSGILAIAAAKLGYSPVRAFDFDAAAVRVAKINAKKNRTRVAIRRADLMKIVRPPAKYDVVCANLTADLLQNFARKLQGFVKPGGLLILAGILRAQINSLRKCFVQRGFSMLAQRAEGEWESMALRNADT